MFLPDTARPKKLKPLVPCEPRRARRERGPRRARRGEWSHPPADPSPQRGHKESEARVEATVWCMGCIMGWITVEHGGEKRVDPGWIRGVDQGWIRVDQGGSGWIRRGKSCVEGRKCMQNVGGCTQAEYRLAGETVPSIIKERKRPVSSSCRRGGTAGASGVVPSRILGRRPCLEF